MKRLIIMVIAVVAGVTGAMAQFRYGLRIGGDFSMPHATMAGEAHGGSGFAGGLTCEWQSQKSGFAAGLSAIYDHRPVSYTPASGAKQCLASDFISFPVDLKYKFWLQSVSGLAAPYIVTGPDIAVRTGGGTGRRVVPGWNIGVGFDVVNFLQLSAGYRLGLDKIDPGVRADGIYVSFAMLFDI